MNKTQWLDWLEATSERLQQRYRDAWSHARRRPRRAPPAAEPKRWSVIRPNIDREAREVVVHIELPEPHTVEADVRVIKSTLSIAVLRRGSHIERAPLEDCYRRAIPLPPKVDPKSATHMVHGDELVIRLRPRAARRRPAKSGAATANGEKTESAAAPRRAKAAPARRRANLKVAPLHAKQARSAGGG